MATALMFVVLASILAFTLVSSSILHLSLSMASVANTTARNNVDDVIASGMGQLLRDSTWGTHQETLTWPAGLSPATAPGVLTFDPQLAATLGIAPGLNNVAGTRAQPGAYGDTVPAGCVQVAGIGRNGNGRCVIEAVVDVVHFPYVIDCDGTINATNVLVATSDSLTSLTTPINPALLQPGNVNSNCDQNNALTISGSSVITGDADAVGTVHVAVPQSQILGQIDNGSQPVPVPQIDIPGFDPGGLGATLAASNNSLNLAGIYRGAGNVQVNGDLKMTNAILFVNGDLKVTGGVSGLGAIIVTGNFTVNGAVALTSRDTFAVLAGGNVTLKGGGANASDFYGIVYTTGSLVGSDITLAGVYLAEGPQSSVQLTNANLIGVPQFQNVTVNTILANGAPAGQVWGNLVYVGKPPVVQFVQFPQVLTPEQQQNEIATLNYNQGGVSVFPPGYQGAQHGQDLDAMLAADDPSVVHDLQQYTVDPALITLLGANASTGGQNGSLDPLIDAFTAYAVGITPPGPTFQTYVPGWQTGNYTLNLPLNQFIGPQEHLSVVVWREW